MRALAGSAGIQARRTLLASALSRVVFNFCFFFNQVFPDGGGTFFRRSVCRLLKIILHRRRQFMIDVVFSFESACRDLRNSTLLLRTHSIQDYESDF